MKELLLEMRLNKCPKQTPRALATSKAAPRQPWEGLQGVSPRQPGPQEGVKHMAMLMSLIKAIVSDQALEHSDRRPQGRTGLTEPGALPNRPDAEQVWTKRRNHSVP